jgi:Uma2 family endonuclease
VFHGLQPQLLSRTLQLTDYTQDNYFTASDLNLYYDVQHPLWHKRPDWFLAVGVPALYDDHDLRRSYVVWQEGQAPCVVVEFLSPSTEREDLGRFFAPADQVVADSETKMSAAVSTPGKLEVYEQYLRVPHYIVYSRYTQRLRYFKLVGRQYEEQPVQDLGPMIWLTDLQLGLGIWEGCFEGIPGHWLRWCDKAGNWCLTDTEQAQLAKEQAEQAKEQALRRAEQLAAKLRELGINPDEV